MYTDNHACACVSVSCWCRPDYLSSLLRGQVFDSDVIDLHKLVARDETTICRTTWTHKTSLCCHAWGCSVGLHSYCNWAWWQAVVCILVISFHLSLMHNFSPASPNLTIPLQGYQQSGKYLTTVYLFASFSILTPSSTLSVFNTNVTFIYCPYRSVCNIKWML